MAPRIALVQGDITAETAAAIVSYVSPVALFASGAEAAKRGMAELDDPGPKAVRLIEKIGRARHDIGRVWRVQQ